MLDRLDNVEVVGEAADGRTAVKLCAELRPDIVLIDDCMPLLNGIEASRRIIKRRPQTKVVICAARKEQRIVEQALHAGASGYLLKDSAGTEVALALQAVSRGEIYLSATVATAVVNGYIQIARTSKRPAGNLSPREQSVLRLFADGKTQREIGEDLRISAKAVELHRIQLMAKIGANSLAELTKYAVREGLTSLDS